MPSLGVLKPASVSSPAAVPALPMPVTERLQLFFSPCLPPGPGLPAGVWRLAGDGFSHLCSGCSQRHPAGLVIGECRAGRLTRCRRQPSGFKGIDGRSLDPAPPMAPEGTRRWSCVSAAPVGPALAGGVALSRGGLGQGGAWTACSRADPGLSRAAASPVTSTRRLGDPCADGWGVQITIT